MPPDRTKEELEQIKKDFIEIKKVWDEKMEKIPGSFPNPFNDKTRKEEIAEYEDKGIRILRNLLDSGKLKSCEALTLIEKTIERDEEFKANPPWWARNLGVDVLDSNQVKVVDNISLDKMVKMLKKLPFDDPKINEKLDKIGTSACTPRAFLGPQNENHPSRFRT